MGHAFSRGLNDRIDVGLIFLFFKQGFHFFRCTFNNGIVNRSLLFINIQTININTDPDQFLTEPDIDDILNGINQESLSVVFNWTVNPVISIGSWTTLWKTKMYSNIILLININEQITSNFQTNNEKSIQSNLCTTATLGT